MHVGNKRLSKKWAVTLACLIVFLIASLAVWFFVFRNTGPIPRKYMRGVDYTLYYPTRLPKGYTVDRGSFERKGEVLIFSINAPGNKNVAVAQQPIPADAPSRSTSKAPMALPGERNFSTAAGQAHIGLWGDKYVSDIITPTGTWVILNTNGFTADEAASIVRSFTQLNR